MRSSFSEAPKESYLHAALSYAADKTLGQVTSELFRQELVNYGVNFTKSVPLFMRGTASVVGIIAANSADSAKVGSSSTELAIDLSLGTARGLALKAGSLYAGSNGWTPGNTGVALGFLSRSSDAFLTSSTYIDKNDGKFNFAGGLSRAFDATFDKRAIGMDLLMMGAADMAFAKSFNSSRGLISYRPVETSLLAASTMGATAGFARELQRELAQDGELNLGKLALRTTAGAAVDGLAGAAGGYYTARRYRIAPEDPQALVAARSNPYQRGELVDAFQQRLRDGVFVPEQRAEGLHSETWFGRVNNPDGTSRRAVFRVNDGSEAFANRMQSEIAGYGMDTLGFKTNIPVTVARSAEINGQSKAGYIQEMSPQTLLQYGAASRSDLRATASNYLQKQMRTNDAFRLAFEQTYSRRMVLGEWDNHALNFGVAEAAGKPVVQQFDLGYAFRIPTSKLEMVPLPHARKAYENANSLLYAELAGRPLSAPARAEFTDLNRRFNNSDGRAQLGALGLTPMQTEVVLGRTKWFADHGYFPKQQESMLYSQLFRAKRTLNQLLGREKHAWQGE